MLLVSYMLGTWVIIRKKLFGVRFNFVPRWIADGCGKPTHRMDRKHQETPAASGKSGANAIASTDFRISGRAGFRVLLTDIPFASRSKMSL